MIAEPRSEPDPAQFVAEAVDRTLLLARTWLAWDGRPHLSVEGDRVYTPHKVIRRMTDHLIDHLAEIEALLSSVPSIPDYWRGSLVTMASDWASFTEAELNEAQQRLLRLASLYTLRFSAISASELDSPRE